MAENNETFDYYADQENKRLPSAIAVVGTIVGAALICLIARLIG
jgi:hypothetical protein